MLYEKTIVKQCMSQVPRIPKMWISRSLSALSIDVFLSDQTKLSNIF